VTRGKNRRHGFLKGATVFVSIVTPLLASTVQVAAARPGVGAGAATTTHHVQPAYTAGNITSCPAGTTTFINTADLTPGDVSRTYSKAGTTFDATVDSTDTYVSFMTNSPGFTVYIKGGPAYDTYDYTGTTKNPAYSSDTGLHSPLNNGGNVPTISHYLVCGQPAAAVATPTLSTVPGGGGTVGSVVLNDTAILSGGSSPGGSIIFSLYDPSDSICAKAPAFTQTVTVSDNGHYSTTNTVAATTTGTWNWTVAYSGDGKNNGALSACGEESVRVAKASPNFSTNPSSGGTIETVVLNDTAGLASGYSAGGSITFNLYSPSDPTCAKSPAFTQTVAVSGNGTYATHNTMPAPDAGTWNWTASYTGDANNKAANSPCGQESVTVSAQVPQGSCAGTGSMASLVTGSDVLSYVPEGSWSGGSPGIAVANVEGTNVTNTMISTGSDVINSCASNSATGRTVCTANNADVWVLKGTGLDPTVNNPLTDAGSGQTCFSGGCATTTGVAMDPTHNQALLGISMSDGNGGYVGGFQLLNLATNTFNPPFATQSPGGLISEDPLIDPFRHFILSATEDSAFEAIDVANQTSPKFFEHSVPEGLELDSTAEDCSTGIILAPGEFSDPSQIYIADINNAGSAPHAVFTPGSPAGTWTAPDQVQTLTGSSLSSGASGSAVAQGTHTGIISGEFGGDSLTAVALPTTSGDGKAPAIRDWVTCSVGNDAAGNAFSTGYDPHTLLAYKSPKNGDAIALIANGDATELAAVDLTKMLDQTTVPSSGHVCTGNTLPSTVVRLISLPTAPTTGAPVFTADTPPTTAVAGMAYTYTFAATGTPAPKFSVASGTLPTGLSLDPDSGMLAGTPTTAGTFDFTVTADNGVSPAAVTSTLTITVTAKPTAPTFTADSPPMAAAVGTPYTYTFTATGAPTPTYAVAAGSLPDGLSLDQSSGTLSGKPASAGSFNFTIRATNGISPDALTPTITITVTPKPTAPTFTADSPPTAAAVGTPYTYTFTATGAPTPTYAVAAGSLPDGLDLDQSSGTLSGTPATAGSFSFIIRATNGISPDALTPTITITVSEAGAFLATDDFYTVQNGRELDVPAKDGVLANDTSAQAGTLTALIDNDNALGTVTLQPDGSFTYIPPPGFTGTDSFTYKARDSHGSISNSVTVSIDVTAGGPPTPTLTSITPAAGTTITGPARINATLTPPTGQTINAWNVSYRRPESPTQITLNSGTGPNVTADFDPTLIRDGTYSIDIRATASGGGILAAASSLTVDGTYKPGRYSTTFRDLTVNVAGLPVDIQRTYDSTDKTPGDFGVGWHMDLADFRVDTNGPLGARGWSASSCGLFGAQVCYTSAVPHIVTITWPDGHVEKFDMTPANGSAFFFPNITAAAFTPEPGATSTLEAVDNGIVLDGNIFLEGGIFETTGIYDPLQFVLTAKDGTQYLLDRHLGLTSETDPNGNTITIDPSGIHSSSGPSIGFTRDAEDRITRIADPAGGAVTYTYSAEGDLVATENQDGSSARYAYSGNHLLTGMSGAAPALTLTYDSQGRVSSVTDATGATVSLIPGLSARQETFTGPNPGLTTVNTYDAQGNLVHIDKVFGGHDIAETRTYDGSHNLLSDTTPTGTTTFTYDANGNQTKIVDPDGVTTEATYDQFGEPLETKVNGQVVSTTDYNTAGLPTKVHYPDGTTESYAYDARGLEASHTDRSDRVTNYTYDASGGLATVQTAAGTTRYVRDDDGRIVQETSPTGAVAKSTYNGTGQLVAYTDGNGHTWRSTYDAAGNLSSNTDPLGHVRLYSYDGAGRLAHLDNRAGQSVTYQYGPDGQPTDITGSDGTHVTASYDPLGRPTTLTTEAATVTYQWDDGSRPIAETITYPGTIKPVTLSQEWTPADKLAKLTDPYGATSFNYDQQRNLVGAVDTGAGTFAYTYDSANRLTKLVRPNGATDTFSWQGTDLLHQVTTDGSATANRLDYTYDNAGRLATRTDNSGTHTYAYDANDQLTGVTHPSASGLPDESYTYDAAGNRTSWLGHSGVRYDAANRLLTDGQHTYTYDDEGRQTSVTDKATGAITTYHWNALDQLIEVKNPTSDVTYGYDALGNRVVADTNGAKSYTVYDSEHSRHLTLAADGSLLSRYVNEPALGAELAVQSGGSWIYPILDFQRTAVASMSDTGQILSRAQYNSFGGAAGDLTPEAQWHGIPPGPGGLLLTWARAYDPDAGRFLSEDPMTVPNLYAYAQNQPCDHTDPTGLSALTEYLQTLRKCVAKAGYELHHVISKWALKNAGAIAAGVPVLFALIPQDLHQLTNNYGGWSNSQYVRELERIFLASGDWEAIMEEQIEALKELAAVAPFAASVIFCL
jgi:RHS repeat-associated protein